MGNSCPEAYKPQDGSEPKAYLKIEYCGGWGYGSKVVKLYEAIEKVHPNMVEYRNVKDKGMTGRFEVTVYKTVEHLESDVKGKLIHSKKESGKFPFDDNMEKFMPELEEYLKWWPIAEIQIMS